MNAKLAVLAVLAAAAVTLASVAAAGPVATKQRVAFDVKILPQGTFVLTPFTAGALKRDLGTVSGNWRSISGREVMRDGQKVTIYNGLWTFTGKRGTLTIRERNELVDIGNDGNFDGQQDEIGIGTWTVVRGTGAYAAIKGSGRSAHEGLGRVWFARYEGVLTVPRG
jgi:hypothetical protein